MPKTDQTQSIKDTLKLHRVKMNFTCFTMLGMKQESICKAYNKLKIHSDNSLLSMVKMLQNVQEVGNKKSTNAHDLEDWVNLDNALPTTEQIPDIPLKLKVVTRKMMAQRRNKFPIQRQQNVSKRACPGWKDRTMLTRSSHATSPYDGLRHAIPL